MKIKVVSYQEASNRPSKEAMEKALNIMLPALLRLHEKKKTGQKQVLA